MIMDNSVNNKRIAKNTLLLYFRTLFVMLVALYTSRVVLGTLGVTDYGIYNVVGGVVAMFGFLNSAMTTATQRYITFSLGKGDEAQVQTVFSTALQIHVLISALVVILCETVGLWFMYEKMQIPADRINAAFWVFQCSIASTVIVILSVPYNAAIVAHEQMSAFAYISIVEVVLKLLVVYLIKIVDYDRLIFYAILILSVQLIARILYGRYCSCHFKETKFRRVWNKTMFREMLSFAGWNLWGNCASVAFTQGVNILLNMFFGPVVNAARGIAVQVQAAVAQFSANFQTAINPQITKSYAVQNYAHMHSLIYSSSKFTFYLLLLVSLPIILETNYILHLWLGTYPDCTGAFVRLILCITIIDSMTNPLGVAVSATGKVKVYQGVLGGVLLSILPVSYIFLKLGGNPVTVFVVHLNIVVIAFLIRLLIIRPLIRLSLYDYGKRVVLPCVSVAVVSLILLVTMKKLLMLGGTAAFFAVCLSSAFCVPVIAYEFGLSVSERAFIRGKLSDIMQKLK